MEKVVSATVFVNSTAGGGKASRIVAEVRRAFAQAGYAAEYEEPRSVEEFCSMVRAAIHAGCKTLIAMGGDGTLQALVREALHCPVTFGIIPSGGGNDFASALGIRNWQAAVQPIAQGNSRPVDLLRVQFKDSSAIYLGGGGVGLDAEAARLASQRFANWRGRSRYVAAAISALRGFPGVDVELEFPANDSSAVRRKVLLAAALNTPSYGGGLRLAPEAQLDDGLAEVVLIEMLSNWEVAALIPHLLLTGELKTGRVQRLRSSRIKLKTPEGTWFHGDGELLCQDPREITVLPKAIRVLAP